MSTPTESLGFPRDFLLPLQTAVGPVYPPPKLRKLLEDLDNVQKRMAQTKMFANPERLQRVYPKKALREETLKKLREEFNEQQKELEALQERLQRMPLQPEHMMHPQWFISYCCKAATRPKDGDDPVDVGRAYTCMKCGRDCSAYRRMEKEDWKAEYQAVCMQRTAELKEDQERVARGEKKQSIMDKPRGYVPYAS